MLRFAFVLTGFVLFAACGKPVAPTPPPAVAATENGVPLFEGLGSYTREVTTSVPAAQAYFD